MIGAAVNDAVAEDAGYRRDAARYRYRCAVDGVNQALHELTLARAEMARHGLTKAGRVKDVRSQPA